MRILLTGADQPLGRHLAAALGQAHEVTAVGQSAVEGCRAVDLRQREAVEALLAQSRPEVVIHAMPYDAAPGQGADAEQVLLDRVARGTYVLTTASLAAGVGRMVLGSQLALMADYPADFVVRPDWLPLPRPEAASLAPYMAELTCREIARARGLQVVCLRIGALDEGQALEAVQQAMTEENPQRGHSWAVRHIGERD